MKIDVQLLFDMLIVLGVAIVIGLIVFVFWTIVLIPVKEKKKLDQEVVDQKSELEQIQIQKGVEWDSYKELVDETNKLRLAYIKLKKEYDSKVEEAAKKESSIDNLKAANKELKKNTKPEATKDPETTKKETESGSKKTTEPKQS